MSDAMITNGKKCLKNLTKCQEIYSSEDPMGGFGEAIRNFYSHYTDDHSSTWCRFHKKVPVTIHYLTVDIKTKVDILGSRDHLCIGGGGVQMTM